MDGDISNFTVPLDTPISRLEAGKSFTGLDEKEKLYCHYLSRAAWSGSQICLLQTSPESVPIYLLLTELFSRQTIPSLRQAVGQLITDDEFKELLLYSCAVFSNMGNYKSFGDTKIVPSNGKDKFHSILKHSVFYQSEPDVAQRLWNSCSDAMYSLTPRERQLGLGEEGISTYYSSNCTSADAELVQKFMQEKDIESYNTRLFKTVKSGEVCYELRLASVCTSSEPCGKDDKVASFLGDHQFQSCSIRVTRGDYAPLMQRINENLAKAKEYASNEHEKAMIESYIRSFNTGSVEEHKEGSRHWIKNKGPVVETYMGFIESYRDPFGVRGEYEGFVAIVNKAMSAKFTNLVTSAEGLLPLMPWPREFEKDRFLKPDFTSLDIISFASSGVPAGINIPNYDDIRQNEGFKNVSLGNVLTAAYQDKRITFLSPEDQQLFVQLRGQSFEVQVGLHELLGHGSGKLFQKEEDGSFNFDISNVIHPYTGEKIQSWYNPGETWDTMFRSVASSYEECRAECVGIFLCLSRDVLRIFSHEGDGADDIIYVNWLNMVRAGVLGLEYFTPQTNKWRQAHMQARYVILRVLLKNAPGLVTIERTTGLDGNPDAVVRLDRTKIETVGRKAIGDFLEKLQVYKSTADVSKGEALYAECSTVTDEDGGWLSLRSVVMARKMPRRMLVQPLTVMEGDGNVTLKDYEASAEGIIQYSTEYRVRGDIYDSALETLWRNDRQYWN